MGSDGSVVAFESSAANITSDCTTGVPQIFVRSRATGVTTCIPVAPDGAPGNAPSRAPAISADGRVVAFQSTATDLAPECVTGVPQIFVRDLATGATTCVSITPEWRTRER